MRRKHKLYNALAVVLVILLGAYVYWYSQLEWVEQTVELGPKGEALRNPYLAAEEFLRHKGKQTYFQRGFSGLAELKLGEQTIPSGDTLVLTQTYQALPEPYVQALWQWVQDGGNLILAATNPYIGAEERLPDPLLKRLNLILIKHWEPDFSELVENLSDDLHSDDAEPELLEDQLAAPSELETNNPDQPWQPDCFGASRTGINWPGYALPLVLSAGYSARLRAAQGELDEQNEPSIFESFIIGAGSIHVFAEDLSFTNENIACFDNALLFWELTKNSGKIWFASNASSPSFWRELWRLSAVGCIALLMALALWVWQQGTRFGPIFSIDRSSRRNFIDHIKASATFLYRNRGNGPLLEALRNEVRQRMQIKYSHFAKLSQAQQLQKYQQVSAMAAEDIEKAMFEPLPVPSKRFISTVRRLQHLRNRL